MSGWLIDWVPDADLTTFSPVESAVHRNNMRYLAGAVTVVTTADGESRAGLTATAVVSVTVDPPRLMVFINKNAFAIPFIMQRGALAINVLSDEQEQIAKAFANMIPGVQGEARFDFGTWGTLVTGAPILDKALCVFDTRVVQVLEESTHFAFLCEALATDATPASPLLYFNGEFRRLQS
jgi:flavin reductase (DIM6/NTAB) family NADH-FMN oxidoreductase RutF